MSLGTNGASAAQLEDPEAKNEFAETQAQAEADAAAAQKAQDVADGQLMAAAASDSPASAV